MCPQSENIIQSQPSHQVSQILSRLQRLLGDLKQLSSELSIER